MVIEQFAWRKNHGVLSRPRGATPFGRSPRRVLRRTPVLDIHIRKVARVDGKLTNTIIMTYPRVSQFWTFDPKQFIQQPVFSRDYPPSKFLE